MAVSRGGTRRQTADTYSITDGTKVIGVEPGKVPPQAVEFEEAVLGAIMLVEDTFYDVSEIISRDCFYKEQHRLIYAAMTDLAFQDEPIDALTVGQALRKAGKLQEVGGQAYLNKLTQGVLSAAHAKYHAQIVYQKYVQRELIGMSTRILERSYDDNADIDELLNEAEKDMLKITENTIQKDAVEIRPALEELIQEIHKKVDNKELRHGVYSGFRDIDRVTQGWQPSDLIIIAARPSMGKTAFVVTMARQMAAYNIPVAIFSLEMSTRQLLERLLSAETCIRSDKIRGGNLAMHELDQLKNGITPLLNAPMYFDDTPALSIMEFRSKCRRLVRKYHVKAVIIDYLQQMTAGDRSGSREQEVSLISRTLKAVAKELNIPVIALSQLNRKVEERAGVENKRPQMGDLRESGAIEQDADIIAFIHRPEYYGFLEDKDGNDLRGLAQFIIAKHRNGAVTDVNLDFIADFAKFTNRGEGAQYTTEGTRELSSEDNDYTTFDQSAVSSVSTVSPQSGVEEEVPF